MARFDMLGQIQALLIARTTARAELNRRMRESVQDARRVDEAKLKLTEIETRLRELI